MHQFDVISIECSLHLSISSSSSLHSFSCGISIFIVHLTIMSWTFLTDFLSNQNPNFTLNQSNVGNTPTIWDPEHLRALAMYLVWYYHKFQILAPLFRFSVRLGGVGVGDHLSIFYLDDGDSKRKKVTMDSWWWIRGWISTDRDGRAWLGFHSGN